MPNKDLYNKKFTIPDHVAEKVGRSGSLSYVNMKKIASELNAKKDKSTSEYALLNWIEDSLKTGRDAVDGVKRIKMDTETEGSKESVTGHGNNFKIGTNKDKDKRPTAIGGIPDITTMTKPRNIFNNKMDYIKTEDTMNLHKMRYLMEYMDFENPNKKCEVSKNGMIHVCKFPDGRYTVILYQRKFDSVDVTQPFLSTRKVSLKDLDAEIMNYYANPPFSDPKPEDIKKGESVLATVHDLIKKIN